MLSKETFNSGIKKLTIEYKGFEMSRERSVQWYEFMQDMSDNEFMKKINNCIKKCNHVPYMSDVINTNDDSVESRSNAGAYEMI